MNNSQRYKAFRLAIVTKDSDVISKQGIITFYEDVLDTNLSDITEITLQPTKQLLIGMVNTIMDFNCINQEKVSGLALATFSKLESLAWKTYIQLIRTAYREGSSLRSKHIRVE